MKNVIEAAENWMKEMPEGRNIVLIISDGSGKTISFIHGSESDLRIIIAAALIEESKLPRMVEDAIKLTDIYKEYKGDPTQLLNLDDIEDLPEGFKTTKK